ncbi:MAG TPA: hypothetical protein VFF67_08370 [Thermoplasmata archaeon]|nr:hypothetical protein [Thermoplasmata archaeon]
MNGTPPSPAAPAGSGDPLSDLGAELHALADGVGEQLQATRLQSARVLGVFGVLFGLLALGSFRIYIVAGHSRFPPPATLDAGLLDVILGLPLLGIGLAYLLFPRKAVRLQSRLRARFRPPPSPPVDKGTVAGLLDRMAWTHRELESLSELTFGVGVFLAIIGLAAGILSGTLVGAAVSYSVGGGLAAFFTHGGFVLFPLAGFVAGIVVGALRYAGIKSLDTRLHFLEMRLGGLSGELWTRY